MTPRPSDPIDRAAFLLIPAHQLKSSLFILFRLRGGGERSEAFIGEEKVPPILTTNKKNRLTLDEDVFSCSNSSTPT